MSEPTIEEMNHSTCFIDPRTHEPCKRCNGTGKMPPWPGSQGSITCGVCREEYYELPAKAAPVKKCDVADFDKWLAASNYGTRSDMTPFAARDAWNAARALYTAKAAPEPAYGCHCEGCNPPPKAAPERDDEAFERAFERDNATHAALKETARYWWNARARLDAERNKS